MQKRSNNNWGESSCLGMAIHAESFEKENKKTCVRQITAVDYPLLGKPLSKIYHSQVIGEYCVFFGSYLSCSEKLQVLRKAMLDPGVLQKKKNPALSKRMQSAMALWDEFKRKNDVTCAPQKKLYFETEPLNVGLVDIKKINPRIICEAGYALSKNCLGKAVYSSQNCFVHHNVAKKLDAAQKEFERYGYGLKIWDAYRPASAQMQFWKECPSMFANPNVRGSNHSRGVAVDLTLVDLKTGKSVEMPTPVDELSERADCRFVLGVSKNALQNREFLESIMVKHGFVPLWAEWWHFNDDDCLNYNGNHCNSYPLCDVSFEALKEKEKEVFDKFIVKAPQVYP